MTGHTGRSRIGFFFFVADLVVLLSITVVFSSLAAETVPIRVLTLEQALAVAQEQNRDIQKAREYSNWIYGKYLEERAQALPQLSLNAGVQRQYSHDVREGVLSLNMADPFFPATVGKTTDVTGFDLGITQPLFTWGKLSAAIRAAKMGLATGDQQLRLFRQAALRDVTGSFYDVLLTKALADIAAQSLAQRQRHWEEAKKKFALGTATQYDVLAAQVAANNARPTVIRADNAVRLARDRLQFLLGAGTGRVDAQGSLVTVDVPCPPYDQVLSVALKKRPEVSGQEITIGINHELVKIARAGDKPNFFFSGSYSQAYADFEPNSVDNDSWSAGIFMNFPLFDGFRTKGLVSQAKSNLSSSGIDMAKLQDAIAIEAQIALDQVQEARAILTALEGTVQQAEELLAMAEKGFEFGVKTHLDVQDAQLNLSASKGNLAQAGRDYLVALTHLNWVQGILGETDLPKHR